MEGGSIEQDSDTAAAGSYTEVGSIVTCGHYKQDNSMGSAGEPIEWIVLAYDSASGKSLLLSRYCPDAHRFNADTYRGWDKSETRSWLNGTFLNNAFTAEEQASTVTSRVSTPDYDGKSGGADTEDKLCLRVQGHQCRQPLRQQRERHS